MCYRRIKPVAPSCECLNNKATTCAIDWSQYLYLIICLHTRMRRRHRTYILSTVFTRGCVVVTEPISYQSTVFTRGCVVVTEPISYHLSSRADASSSPNLYLIICLHTRMRHHRTYLPSTVFTRGCVVTELKMTR